MARLASVAPGEEKFRNEVKQKLREVSRLTCLLNWGVDRCPFQRLTQWFSNRASANGETRRDTLEWLPLLQRLHQLRNPRPRKRNTV